VSIQRACAVCKQSRSGWYDKPKVKALDAPLKKRMHEIASTRVRFGFWRIYVLIRREGWRVNHKRIYRLYKEEGLNLRSKRPRRRRCAANRMERLQLNAPNQVWSMDFVSDALFNGKKFRALTVVDNHTREFLAIEVGQSLTGDDVAMVLTEIAQGRELPSRIQADNGPEFISIPILRQTSSTEVPVSAWCSANEICSSVNLLFFMANSPSSSLPEFSSSAVSRKLG
jgi:putative transposase